MKSNYLFPPVFQKIGWAMLVVFVILTVAVISFDFLNGLWPCKVFTLIPSETIFGNDSYGFITYNDGWEDEICEIGLAVSMLFIAFSAEKDEDEFTASLRSKSMTWAFLVNVIIFIAATLLIYGMSYLMFWEFEFMIILLLYVGKLKYELHKAKRRIENEK